MVANLHLVDVKFVRAISSYIFPAIRASDVSSSKEVIGNSNILNLDSASLGGEDFAFYLNYIPGVYFRIGCFDGVATDLHCNYFDIDESCIPIGIKILNRAIKNYNFHKTDKEYNE